MGTPAAAAVAGSPRPRYRKLLDLATGGMGRVELALVQGEGNFARFVALKRLHAPFEHDEQFRAMFFDEARLAGLVHHPNVGSVVDVGRDEVGFYLAMEYIDGQTVAALIIRLRELRQSIPVQLACRIMAQAARGLSAAHELRSLTGDKLDLVHRDVSPQNIIVGYDGVVKVVDFGVARAAGRMQTTVGTALKGKLGYMSPEQLSFQSADARSDLFGLGVVLYELLALTRLYRSDDTNDGPRRILHEPPPRLRDLRAGVSKELDELGSSLLAKSPDDRPQTAHEVAVALEGIAAQLAVKEGLVDVGAFIKARFTKELDARRAAIKAALDEEREVMTSPGDALPEPSGSNSQSVSLVRPARPDPTPWIRRAAMASVVVAAVVAGGVIAFVSTGDDEHATPPTSGPVVPETPASASGNGASAPGTGASSASTGASHPNAGASRSGTGPSGVGSGASASGTGASADRMGATHPNAVATHPNAGATHPNALASPPNAAATPPNGAATAPRAAVTAPSTAVTAPSTAVTAPVVPPPRVVTAPVAVAPTPVPITPTPRASSTPRATTSTPRATTSEPRATSTPRAGTSTPRATSEPRPTGTPAGETRTRPRTRPRSGVRIWEWP